MPRILRDIVAAQQQSLPHLKAANTKIERAIALLREVPTHAAWMGLGHRPLPPHDAAKMAAFCLKRQAP
jgi:hypothetical protein